MRNSIRTRLIVAFIGLAIGPLLLVGIILAWQNFTTQERQALNLQREVAQRVAAEVTAFFEEQKNELHLVSRTQMLPGLERNEQHNILKLLMTQGIFEDLILLDSQGQEQIYLSRLGHSFTSLGHYPEADAFVIPRTSGEVYYSSIQFEEITGEPLMIIAVPLLDIRTGLVNGVLISKIRIKKIWDLIADVRISEGQSVYIVDAQDKVVAHRNPSVVLRGTRFNVPDRNGIHSGLTGSRVVLAVDTIRFGQQEFRIVAEQSISEALIPAINTVLITAGLMLTVLVLSGILGVLMVRQIVHPIQIMAAIAEAISTGDLSQQVEVTRQDELGILAGAFNSMTRELGHLITGLEQQIAERKRAEEEIRQLNEELEQRVAKRTQQLQEALAFQEEIMRASSTGIVVYDATGQCVMANEASAKMISASLEQVLAQNYHHIESWQKAGLYETALAAVETGLEKQQDIHIISSFGKEVWLNCQLVPFNSDGQPHLLLTINDMTERMRAESEIRELNQQLQAQANNLAAANKELGAFSYSVSHDLRAPLRAIDGFTRILVEDYESALDAEGQRVCAVIRRQTRRMGQLIDDLLTFSRLSRVDMRASSIDMEALANAAFHDVTTSEEQERIDFRLESLPPTVGDPTLIRQVWINLLSNAVKFSAKRKRAVIKVGGSQDAAENIYFVRDNGAGFDMRYADKLFGVFQRLHSEQEFEGTGVGLAIVQRVIHRHGGRVWAEAEVDKGAVFYFALPRKGA